MNKWKWFYPGIKVKRWIVLQFIGVCVIGIGIALIFDTGLFSVAEAKIMDLASELMPNATWSFGVVIILIGLLLVIVGVRRLFNSVFCAVAPKELDIADTMYRKRSLEKGPRIVVIGGGTGLSTLLRGLKVYSSNITAMVTVADDGGSSGRIRTELGILPPGDIRNTLVALADTEPLMERLFQYRFSWGKGLQGHSFGNLFIAVMNDITGDFEVAISEVSKVLAVRGRVIPSTLETARLKAVYTDGTEMIGESQIPQPDKKIAQVSVLPKNVAPLPETLAAINEADIIVLGPGSLYTSVIPNLLVKDIADALVKSNSVKIYVCNVMTQPGETHQMSAADHLQAILKHTDNRKVVDYMLINNSHLTMDQARKYQQQSAYPVKADLDFVKKLGVRPICAPLLEQSELVRHDSQRLAQEIIKIATKTKRKQRR